MFEWFTTRFSIGEVSGCFGDIGTVIPITIAMAKINSINISSTFFWYGINNIFISYYDLPMTVQPQKTISALAIKGDLDSKSVICAGFLTGIITSFLAFTGLLNKIVKFIPKHLICFIQMSQGLIFVMQGVKRVIDINIWFGIDSYFTSIITGLFILFTWLPWKNKKIKKYAEFMPSALIIFITGLIIAGITYNSSARYNIISPFVITELTKNDFLHGFKATFTQLPLTLLNSVVSTVELSHSMFPDNKLNINNISYTIGLINIFTFIGGAPSCLGCGSLASNFKFKGKSGLVPFMLGIIYILFSVFFGSILLDLIINFPNSMLGVMLIVSGGELALAGSKKVENNMLDYCICVGISLSTNLHTGFLTGIILHISREIVNISNKEEEVSIITEMV